MINDVDGIEAGTGNVLLDEPVSSVPWRNKNSGFF